MFARKISTATAALSAIAAVVLPGAAQAATSATPPATSGGVSVVSFTVAAPGEAAPFALKGVRTPSGGAVAAGDPVPNGMVIVSSRVNVPAGRPAAGQPRSVTLSCPTGMKYAGFAQSEQSVAPGAAGAIGARNTIPGYSSRGQIQVDPGPRPVAFELATGIICRTPAANGSIAENPRKLQRDERAGRICVDAEKLSRTPGLGFRTYVHRGQPVAIQRRSASGTWTRIVSDFGQGGWVRTSALCH